MRWTLLLLALAACTRGEVGAAPPTPPDAGPGYPWYPARDCSLFTVAAQDGCWRRLAGLCAHGNGGRTMAVVKEDGVSWPRRGRCAWRDPLDAGVTPVLVVPSDDYDTALPDLALWMTLRSQGDGGYSLHTFLGGQPSRNREVDGGFLKSIVFCGTCLDLVEKRDAGWRLVAPTSSPAVRDLVPFGR